MGNRRFSTCQHPDVSRRSAMNGSIRVGNLFGIPFYINVSWFLVLGLMTLTYGGNLAAQFSGLGPAGAGILGLITSLLLFTSVLAHELGHSLVAIRQGIAVKSITLFLFGGLASLDQEAKTPADAFWIAVAGPLVSLGIFGILRGIVTQVGVSGPLLAVVSLLAWINLALALFNLIPGLPLDGGNVLKALVWKVTGDQYKGVAFASRVGQVLGGLAIFVGFLPTLVAGAFPNLWTVLVGWFLLRNANLLVRDASLKSRLSEFVAEDAIVGQIAVVPESLSLRQLVNDYVIGQSNANQVFVKDESGKLLGQVQVEALKTVPTSEWPSTPVKQLMQPIEPAKVQVDAKQSLLDVVMLFEQEKLNEVSVTQDGVPIGFIQKSSIRTLLQRGSQTQMSAASSSAG
ncbi:MAG: site-2 protease family protein [Microcoleaceae cyanobacterium]